MWGETGERGVWVAWHASQHASPAVEGALHFELQACTFFPARLADWALAPLALWLDLHHATGTHVRGVEPPPSLRQASNLHALSGT